MRENACFLKKRLDIRVNLHYNPTKHIGKHKNKFAERRKRDEKEQCFRYGLYVDGTVHVPHVHAL